MSWRPPNWKKYGWVVLPKPEQDAYEAGADAMLEAQFPLLRQVYAQLCGVRLQQGKTDYYSALDESIDKLKQMITEEEAK